MENLIKKLESGSEINVTLASFPEGHRLYQAVAKELSKYNLAEGTAENLAMVLASSAEINDALWPCLGRGVYKTSEFTDGLKMTASIFEKVEHRMDFIEIQREVLGYNLIPFSRSIGSLLMAALKRSIATPKLGST